MTTFTPTAEQEQALALYRTGASLAIEAGAGTGKTSTLIHLANAEPDRRGQYIAFNKAIVSEAGEKMPSHVACNTAHSLAFRAVGRRYGARLRNSQRMRSDQVARLLGVDSLTVKVGNLGVKTLSAGFLGGQVMKAVTNFCQSADPAPSDRHFAYIDGIDMPDGDHRTYDNNDLVRDHLLPSLHRAWADLARLDGKLPYRHDHYLKQWQLDSPFIDADVIFFDEAQDANPVMVAIVAAQAHAQIVWVGDSQQQIYEFTGAVNALATIPAEHRTFLTQSFRFGPAVAAVANHLLGMIGAELTLSGLPSIPSTVGPVSQPRAVLTRTNAVAVRRVLSELDAHRKPHLVGGGAEVVSFARAAANLQQGRRTDHAELACFDTWGEVQEYVSGDPQGEDLRLMVKLVDEFGTARIIQALDRGVTEAAADVIVSTAHKSKGREWDSVQLADDFRGLKDGETSLPPAELRLLYVAATRARLALDTTQVSILNPDKPKPAPLGTLADALASKPCPGCGRTDVRSADGTLQMNSDHLGCTGAAASA